MQIITLKNNQSEYFDLITYPDGQHSIKLDLQMLNVKVPILIMCRIRTFSEFEVLMCLVYALQKNDFVVYEIHYMYLFGMRSDRAFNKGEPNYRELLVPLLNTLNIPERMIYFPHSALLFPGFNTSNMANTWRQELYSELDIHNYHIIGGDQSTKFHFPLMCENYFIKTRVNNEIKIIESYEYTSETDFSGKPILIIDDLCDGGATFIAEAKYLKNRFPNISLNLFVVHGLFNKGFDELFQYFDKIYTTNSYQDFLEDPEDLSYIRKEKLHIIKVI